MKCLEVSAEDIPDNASKAVIKAANDCHECEIIDPTQSQTFCVSGQNAISHIEFAECPDADIGIDCENDRAEIAVENTQSVYFTVDYEDCDEANFDGTLTFEDSDGGTSDDWFVYVSLADCDGTLEVFNEQGGTKFDSTSFDCEAATVTSNCPTEAGESPKAIISADDMTVVNYSITYNNCDVMSAEGSVDLTDPEGGTKDKAEVVLEPCDGIITISDPEGRELGFAEFDCEAASVSTNCPDVGADGPTATISADNMEEVNYSISYENCDVASDSGTADLSGSTTSATVQLEACDGTITLTDGEGRELDKVDFDCEAATVETNCPTDGTPTATIEAPGMASVDWSIDYDDDCDAADTSGTADLSGVDNDTATVELAACDGTITLLDGEGRVLDSASFDCEAADVSVNCPTGENEQAKATITADNMQFVDWVVTYDDDCDVATDSGTVDLSGSTTTATVDLAACDGEIEIFDPDGRSLGSTRFDCESTTVTTNCPDVGADGPTATITANDMETVNYSISYKNCDVAGDSGSVDLSGVDNDTATVELEACDGTIIITDPEGRELDKIDFDCEAATVETNCPDVGEDGPTATITADGMASVEWSVEYTDCDVSSDSGTADLSGVDNDTATVPLQPCDGIITLMDGEGRQLDSATFDCDDADVSVNCPVSQGGTPTATITANGMETVDYSITYYDCNVMSSSGSVDLTDPEGGQKDSAQVTLEACDGKITIYDPEGRELAFAEFDCELATVDVNCEDRVATITAENTTSVVYSIDYSEDAGCPVESVGPTQVTLSGDPPSAVVPIEACAGTITVTDGEGRQLDSESFDCIPTGSVTANCSTVSLTTNEYAIGDDVNFDIVVKNASGGSESFTDVGVTTVTESTTDVGTASFDYTSLVTLDQWDEVTVTAYDLTANRELDQTTVTGLNCGCPACPSDAPLSVKFEESEVKLCQTKSQMVDLDGDGTQELVEFQITELTTKGGSDEALAVCFTSNIAFCELEVFVKAGRNEGSTVVSAETDGEAEPCGIDEDVPEYCVTVQETTGQDKNAISHFTITCPGGAQE